AAESFAALAGGLPACDALSVTALLAFDNVSYNRAPRVLAASNIPSRADGNDTLIVLNRLGGSLASGAATLGSLFGILYDEAANAFNQGHNLHKLTLTTAATLTVPIFPPNC